MSNTPHHLDIDNIAERANINNENIQLHDIESGRALVRTGFVMRLFSFKIRFRQDLISFILKTSFLNIFFSLNFLNLHDKNKSLHVIHKFNLLYSYHRKKRRR